MAMGCHALSALPAEQAAVDFALAEFQVDIRHRSAEIFEFAFLGGLATNGASDLAKRSKHDFSVLSVWNWRFSSVFIHRHAAFPSLQFLRRK
jgi:hypothetical protein